MREKPRDRERLLHIIEAIQNIQSFTSDMDYAAFSENKMAQFAVVKNFEIIGEAAYHITNELRKKATAIEWKKIIAFRHILVHDYYSINLQTVWRAKETKLKALESQLKTLIKSIDEE